MAIDRIKQILQKYGNDANFPGLKPELYNSVDWILDVSDDGTEAIEAN